LAILASTFATSFAAALPLAFARCPMSVRRRFTARSTRAAISPVSSSPTDSESLAPVWDSARKASQRSTTCCAQQGIA
jgi:hypothetical protein